jgi:hypothetical protein
MSQSRAVMCSIDFQFLIAARFQGEQAKADAVGGLSALNFSRSNGVERRKILFA